MQVCVCACVCARGDQAAKLHLRVYYTSEGNADSARHRWSKQAKAPALAAPAPARIASYPEMNHQIFVCADPQACAGVG